MALGNFEITQRKGHGNTFTIGLVGFTSMICNHFHISSNTAIYLGAGMASRNTCTTHCASPPRTTAQTQRVGHHPATGVFSFHVPEKVWLVEDGQDLKCMESEASL